MRKIILIRHGKASFGQTDYDHLSEMGKRQSIVTGQYFKKINSQPAMIFAGELKRQKQTAQIVLSHAGINNMPIQCEYAFNEYDFTGIINTQLPSLIEDDPSMTNDINNSLMSDPIIFRRVFNKIMERWVSGKHDSSEIENFEAFTNRVTLGIQAIVSNLESNQMAMVFTSGGVMSIAMHLVLGLLPIKALQLGWHIWNCSVTSFYFTNKEYQLETFNSAMHLEMESKDLLSYI